MQVYYRVSIRQIYYGESNFRYFIVMEAFLFSVVHANSGEFLSVWWVQKRRSKKKETQKQCSLCRLLKDVKVS